MSNAQPPSPPPQIGPWSPTQLLARGGGGAVWLARRQGEPAEDWVIKCATGGAEADVLAREWQALHDIALPMLPEPAWLVRLPQTSAVSAALVMRRVHGQPLHLALAGASLSDVVTVGAEVLRGLSVLHAAGWVHGDLHPGNVLVHRVGQRVRVQLLDLGLSDSAGQPIRGPGLLAQAAPDRLVGGLADPRDDLFSLACSLYQAWTGQHAWPGYPARQPVAGAQPELQLPAFVPEIDRGEAVRVLNALRAMCAVDRAHRPQSADAALFSWLRPGADHPLASWADDLEAASRRPGLDRAAADAADGGGTAQVAWTVGPTGLGCSAVVAGWAARIFDSGAAWARLEADADGIARLYTADGCETWAHAASEAPAMLDDAQARAGVAAAQWLAAQLSISATGGWLLVPDLDALPADLRWALMRCEPPPGWRVRGRARAVPAGVPAVQRTGLTEQALGSWLSAASGARRWDGALVAKLAGASGGQRVLAVAAAARAIRLGWIAWHADSVAWSGTAMAPAIDRCVNDVASPPLPSAAAWPTLAWVCAVGAAHWAQIPAEFTAEGGLDALLRGDAGAWLRQQADGAIVLHREALRARLSQELPAFLVAQALRAAALHAERPVQRTLLELDAWRLVGGSLPDPQATLQAVLHLERSGRPEDLIAHAAAWVPAAAALPAAVVAPVAAAWLRAVTASGRFAVAQAMVSQWPSAFQEDRAYALARVELAFRAAQYPECRALAEAQLVRSAQDGDAWLWLAFAATWQGDREAAAQALERATALAPHDGPRRDLITYLAGLQAYYGGRLDDAERSLQPLADRAAGALHAATLGALGLVAHRRGDLAQARVRYSQAATEAEAVGDRSRAINMAMNVAVVDHEAGELGAALQSYGRVIGLAEQLGNAGAAARARTNRGNLLSSLGLFDAAALDLEPALQTWREVGNAHLQGNVLCLLGEVARRQGRLAAADQLLHDADVALEQAGAATERLEIQIELGNVELQRGLVEQARARAEAVRRDAAGSGHGEWQARALVLRAQCDLDAHAWRPVDREHLSRLDEDLRLALDLLPAAKPLHHNLAIALRVRLALQRARLDEGRQLAVAQVAVLQRVAASLGDAERAAFERAPGDPAARALLEALAALPPGPTGDVARPGLLTTLVAINRRLGEQRDIPQILETLMDSAILLTGAERGFLLIDDVGSAESREDRALRLRVAVARNLDRENLRRPQHKLSHTVAEDVFLSGEAVLSVDAQSDTRFAEQASVHSGALRSILCVPLRALGDPLGVVYIDNRFAAGAFTDEHATLLAALADQAAIALQTARLLEQQRKTADALEKSRAEVEVLNAQLRAQLADVEHQLDDARADLQAQRVAIAHRSDYSAIKGESPQLLQLFGLMDRVRDHDFPLLIVGESGTGKELVARAIHFTGNRKKGPFVAINCGALPSNLLESELFGHVRGSFTGAVAERRGLFEAAHNGTLLLDEVGEMPLEMQVKLLRVLQTGEITRVGESQTRKVDVRVLAATHRDLNAMTRAGGFREDLLYRLKVVELRIPPLRQRPGDIGLLTGHFVTENRLAGIGKVEKVAKAALQRLVQFPWPGNIRQLEMVLKSACLFADGAVLELADVEPLLERERHDEGLSPAADAAGLDPWLASASLQDIEARVVLDRVALHGGNKRRAAESLGIDRGTLYKKLAEAPAGRLRNDVSGN